MVIDTFINSLINHLIIDGFIVWSSPAVLSPGGGVRHAMID